MIGKPSSKKHSHALPVLTAALAFMAFTGPLWAAVEGEPAKAAGMGGSGEGAFVAAIIILLVVGRGLGEILERVGQPAVMGQLIGGILLGPSLFGWVWPEAQQWIFSQNPEQQSMIEAVSQLGILMLLLLTGMETDLRLVRRVGAACVSISTSGILVPFVCGFTLAQFLPASLLPEPEERVVAGLFMGTALSISSVKIVAIIVREMGFMRRNLGQVIVSSAIIEDTIGWLIIAVTFGIATQGKLEAVPLLVTIAEVAAFMVFSFTIGRRIVFTLIRWSNDNFRSEYAVITMILVIMGVMALTTNLIGVHTVLGAFVAGILVGESPILSEHIEAQLRGIITALFMPVFFGMAGLAADLTVLADPTLLLLTIGLVLIASVGKFGGAFIGGELAGMNRKEATAVGCAMNARGSTEVIVASIGLGMNILSHNLFTMIVTMAVITTLAMPPMLRWALGRIPMGEEEKERVEREVLDQRGFVSRLERLLLAADDSSVGRFTAYVAGLIGGSSGMPTTLLRLTGTSAAVDGTDKGTETHLEEIKRGAEASATAVERAEDVPVEKVHLTARTESGPTGKIIAEEARKGYDMLIVGLGKALTPKGAFNRKINDLTGGFDGPLCLVVKGPATGKAKMPALTADETILVPVNGTDVSRRAADVALAIARPHRARVKVLYVSPQRKGGRDSLSHRHEEAVLKDIVDLAERYDVPVVTAMHVRGAAADAIRKEAAKDASLVVLGASQRPGDELFFGETASAVISGCTVPVIIVAGERIAREDKRPEKDTAEAAKKEAEKAEQTEDGAAKDEKPAKGGKSG